MAHELTQVVQQSQAASIVQPNPLDGEKDLPDQQGRAEDKARLTALDMVEPTSEVYMCSNDKTP